MAEVLDVRKTSGPTKPPKLTDAERHKRFLAMAREVEGSEKPEDFDKAFESIMAPEVPPSRDDA